MPWLQLSVEIAAVDVESVSDCLSALGALSVTLRDRSDAPVFEPAAGETPLWSQTQVVGLFRDDIDMDAITTQLHDVLGSQVTAGLSVEAVADQAWERVWLNEFKPMRFGSRLWICPGGQRIDADDAVVVDLDPGLAFGTGTHATTALCLTWLDMQVPRDAVVIDYGCGSGVLAIAALKLGARSAWAVDNDPQALIAAEDNAIRNQVAAHLKVVVPEQLPETCADVLLANILARPLLELAPRFAQLVRPGGRIALSGILSAQADAVLCAYQHDFVMEQPLERDGWALLHGRRNAN